MKDLEKEIKYIIEKDILLVSGVGGSRKKYPKLFELAKKMNVGDSVFVETFSEANCLSNSYLRTMLGLKAVIAKHTDKKGFRGYRVWRV